MSEMSDTPEPIHEPRAGEPAPAPRVGEPKRVFIRTYGCQMNVYDSTRMADSLEADGYQATDKVDEADLVLLNTCHIREKAAEKVYSELGRIRQVRDRRVKEGGRPMTVGVTGCVAQAEGEEIARRAPVVDLVVGPQTYHRLPEIVRRAQTARQVETDYDADSKFRHLKAATAGQIRARGPTAFLTVQEGCDKFCTFCVVPYTRGAETSRPAAAIEREARDLAAAGVREITLLGQNVNAWAAAAPDDASRTGSHGGTWGLGELLRRLATIPGLARLRYTTSHPMDMVGPLGDALIAAHRDLPVLMPYLHLPVQAGSDRVLKRMNRSHTGDDYRRIVERIRRARPDIALSGDFIVGFPGETDADFEDTLALVREVGYAQAFSFKYSRRPGTPGADMGDQVPEDVKSDRLQALQALLNEQQAAFNAAQVGRILPVLVEKPGRQPGQVIARSPYLQSVICDESVGRVGDIVEVSIASAGPNSLTASRSEAVRPGSAPQQSAPQQSAPLESV